ncbi:hypothetical protein BO78DRAFT_303817 [Aspergillus sclerotiicarbonarius CBS 121057]|uniref:Uncharacterized protein n=1 Tax=Aspergillus sclerotiicarbonarius (strain CBS 121057 / IBT 28362) TaxID=1448318 RepID=A0A319F5U9_ASPSB|nr:hypothetical protein BO78DRAFT_303817 [Aspergillus sclerotiicarbonarius CBS 121057]
MALIRLYQEYEKICESGKKHKRRPSLGVGRSDASRIIDEILQSHHRDWDMLDDRKRSALRASFHERKRYGKRWSLVVDGLGYGGILLCSQRMVNMIHNSSVTLKTLDAVIKDIRSYHPDVMHILDMVKPLADDLLGRGRISCDASGILRKIQEYQDADRKSHA